MFSERLKQLGLEEIIERRQSDEDYQVAMAKKLRAIACEYVAGRLKNPPIPDGSAVKVLRQFIEAGTLYPITAVDQFVQSQAKNGTWAEHMNFVMGELLGCNIALATDDSLEQKLAPSIWDNDTQNQTTTLAIKNNNNNTHWEAIVDGKPVPTKGDGNCYYNAVALSLKSVKIPKPAVKSVISIPTLSMPTSGMTEKQYRDVIENQKQIEETIRRPAQVKPLEESPVYRTSTSEEQIKSDYEYALKLAAEELSAHRMSTALRRGFFAEPNQCNHPRRSLSFTR